MKNKMKKISDFQRLFVDGVVFASNLKGNPDNSNDHRVVNISYHYTRTLKSLQKKGYLTILRFATAANNKRQYMTVVKLHDSFMNAQRLSSWELLPDYFMIDSACSL